MNIINAGLVMVLLEWDRTSHNVHFYFNLCAILPIQVYLDILNSHIKCKAVM